MHRNLPAFLRVGVFQPTELVTVETGRWVSVEDLIQRTLTYSSSPEDGPTTDLSQESLHLGLSADGGFAACVVALPMVRKKQQAPLAFKNASKLGDWLEKHHGTATELWVRIFKSDTGVPSVTRSDCVIESIRVGWIDGYMKPFDDTSYLQRLTPRKVNSNWSAKNCRHATTLIAEGRMLPAGLAQVEAAKSDGRWDTAYAGSADMTIPQDFLDALEHLPAAKAFFATLDRRNLYSIYYRLHTAKNPETRARRIAQIVAKLDRGTKFH